MAPWIHDEGDVMSNQEKTERRASDADSDHEELERTQAAYRAARKKLGLSYAPQVAAAVVAGLLLFGAGAGGMYVLLGGNTDARASEQRATELQEKLEKAQKKNETLVKRLDKSKSDLVKLRGELSEERAKNAAAKDGSNDVSETARKESAADAGSLDGTWTSTFTQTHAGHGENCLFGRDNPVKLTVKNWDASTRIFDADLTVAYHGHRTNDILSQTKTVEGDVVKTFPALSGTIDSQGDVTWTLPVDGSTSHTLFIRLEVSGIDERDITMKMTVESYYDSMVVQVRDSYDLARS